MTLPFKGLYIFTQDFGGNPAEYSKFLVLFPDGQRHPMKGHNGLDFGCPTRTEIIAPHNGTVIEALLDETGYGWYVKIENDQEGSVIAHLETIDVQVGFKLNQGDHVGWSDNTGNSTGPHCHWGYYTFPRDRANGYAGFIDQKPQLEKAGIHLTLGQLPKIDNKATTSESITTDTTYKGLDLSNLDSMRAAVDAWYDVENGKYKSAKEYQDLSTQLEAVKQQLSDTQIADKNVSVDLKNYNEFKALGYNTVDDLNKKLAEKDSATLALQQENTKLLQRIDILAGEIQGSAQEDHTTATIGQGAIDENAQLKQTVLEITKVAGAEKPTLESIVSKIFHLQDMADRYIKWQESQQPKNDTVQTVVNKASQIKQSTGDYLLQLFTGKKGVN